MVINTLRTILPASMRPRGIPRGKPEGWDFNLGPVDRFNEAAGIPRGKLKAAGVAAFVAMLQ